MKGIWSLAIVVLGCVIAEGRFIVKRDVSQAFKVCLEVLLIDCDRTYKADGDETICGSNNVTYSDLCHFSQARCAKHDLLIQYSGHCGRVMTRPTTLPPTTMAPTTLPPTTTAPTTQPQTTMAPTTQGKTSMAPTTTEGPTTWPPTTTQTPTYPTTLRTQTTKLWTTTPYWTTVPVPVTLDPALSIVKQVFCKQTIHIVCNSELDALCGSDGNFYLNRCTFAKAECTNAQLEPISDLSFCTNN